MTHSKGISWIDDCRIPYTKGDVDKINFDRPRLREKNEDWILTGGFTFEKSEVKEYNTDGRFPANILVSDDMLNDGVISKSQDNIRNNTLAQKIYGGGNGLPPQASKGFNDKGTNSRYYDIDKWFDKIINYE